MHTDINFKLQQSSLFRKCSFFVLCIAPLSLQALVPRNPNEPLSPEEQRGASRLNRALQPQVRQLEREQAEERRRAQEEERQRTATMQSAVNFARRIVQAEYNIVRRSLQNQPNAQTDDETIRVTIGILPTDVRIELHHVARNSVLLEDQLAQQQILNRRRTRGEQADQNPNVPKRDRRR